MNITKLIFPIICKQRGLFTMALLKYGTALILGICSVASWAQTNHIYTYSVPSGGYAPNSNLVNYSDSVTGSWTMQYDNLNRLHTATASSAPYNNTVVTWEYDSFGNRLSQSYSGSPSVNVGDTWAHYDLSSDTTPHNRITSSPDSPSEGSVSYDGNGNLTDDGRHRFAYDVENRLCGVYDLTMGGNITQYLYDAEGRRVAKGHPAIPPTQVPVIPYCAVGGSSFVVDEKYVLGPSGEQVTQLDGSNSWQHTNIYAGAQLLATYDQQGSQQPLHFNITDPLGTKRIQTSAAGVKELTCLSLPFGDGPDCDGLEATRHRFTGKERDTESGLDYFGARYYASSMGRWMSPDWADKPEAVPYSSLDDPQSLNLYGYVNNNPLSKVDKDGHCVEAISCSLEFGAGGSFFGPVGTGVGVAIGAGVGLYIEYKAAQALGNYLHNQEAAPATPAAATEQGRDAQGKFLPKQGGEAQPGAAAEAAGLAAAGATKNNNEVINGTKRDGTGIGTVPGVEAGQHVEVKSGETISNSKQLAAMGKAAVAATGKPLVVVTTNPNARLTGPAKANENLVHKPLNQ